jgi:hypothetical protein
VPVSVCDDSFYFALNISEIQWCRARQPILMATRSRLFVELV